MGTLPLHTPKVKCQRARGRGMEGGHVILNWTNLFLMYPFQMLMTANYYTTERQGGKGGGGVLNRCRPFMQAKPKPRLKQSQRPAKAFPTLIHRRLPTASPRRLMASRE